MRKLLAIGVLLTTILSVGLFAHFAVSAERKGPNALITLHLPETDNIWVCVMFRETSDHSYVPRWCGPPPPEKILKEEIPNWPPAGNWEVSAFVQWRETPEQTTDFGYAETDWSPVK